MDESASKHVVEAALLAAGRPLSLDKLVEIFSRKGVDVDRADLRAALSSLAEDYASRGIELKEVASGFRVQVRSRMRDWLDPLFEERAPRYTRALLETLALIAYRQPITRAEIEEVRGVAVSTNIVRTLIERGWVRVVGHRDVPGKPAMLGTTREFLDYFGLRRLDDLPPLSELRDLEPMESPQADLVDRLEEAMAGPPGLALGDETGHASGDESSDQSGYESKDESGDRSGDDSAVESGDQSRDESAFRSGDESRDGADSVTELHPPARGQDGVEQTPDNEVSHSDATTIENERTASTAAPTGPAET